MKVVRKKKKKKMRYCRGQQVGCGLGRLKYEAMLEKIQVT